MSITESSEFPKKSSNLAGGLRDLQHGKKSMAESENKNEVLELQI